MRNMAALSRAMDIIAAKKRLLILCCLMAGQKRFNEIKRECGDTSSAELSKALSFLVSNNIVVKVYESDKRPEYRLTALGKELDKVLYAMEEWGRKV